MHFGYNGNDSGLLYQETLMPAQGGYAGASDDFQVEVNRMRNSLNALTLKQFMFDDQHKVQFTKIEKLEEPQGATFDLKASPEEATETLSNESSLNQSSEELVEELKFEKEHKPAVRFSFFEIETTEKTSQASNELSRDSAEIASINDELPWKKKHTYRNVTPFVKKPTAAFRPIETSISSEEINKKILRPVPVFASKSFQELPKIWDFDPQETFKARSSDDLLLDNIDGCRKPESKTHKLVRMRSTSNSNLFDESLTVAASYQPPPPHVIQKKAPKPLPRGIDGDRYSNTIVYVLDKERDEFVLDALPGDYRWSQSYENILFANNGPSESVSFDSLFTEADPCKL